MALSLQQLQDLASSNGFPSSAVPIAAAIAMAESGGNPGAIGDSGTSFGLWQVHTPAHPQYDSQSLLDPDYNAKAALEISSSGTNWRPWSTYNSGAYAQYLSSAPYTPSPMAEAPMLTKILFLGGFLFSAGALGAYLLSPAPRRVRAR